MPRDGIGRLWGMISNSGIHIDLEVYVWASDKALTAGGSCLLYLLY